MVRFAWRGLAFALVHALLSERGVSVTLPEGLADISSRRAGGVAFSAGPGAPELAIDDDFATGWGSEGGSGAAIDDAAIAVRFRQIFSVSRLRVTTGASTGGRGITHFRLFFATTLPENRSGTASLMDETRWRMLSGLRVVEGQDEDVAVVAGASLNAFPSRSAAERVVQRCMHAPA